MGVGLWVFGLTAQKRHSIGFLGYKCETPKASGVPLKNQKNPPYWDHKLQGIAKTPTRSLKRKKSSTVPSALRAQVVVAETLSVWPTVPMPDHAGSGGWVASLGVLTASECVGAFMALDYKQIIPFVEVPNSGRDSTLFPHPYTLQGLPHPVPSPVFCFFPKVLLFGDRVNFSLLCYFHLLSLRE